MKLKHHLPSAPYSRHRLRPAISSLEVIVSLTLLMSVLSVSLPLIVRHGHLLVAQRHYRQALDELSNQLDRLTSLSGADLDKALKQLSPSPFIAARLANAKLQGESKPGDEGLQVKLHLIWNDTNEERVTMTGWVFPLKVNAAGKSEL